MREKNHVSLNPTALQNILPNSTRPERLIIASDPWGGIPAKNQKGERLNLYLGIIDILQCYKTVKKLEHAWKALLYDGDTVSVHRPSFYSERFERFMFGKVFVSLPMTESLRRLNAQNKQRPKLKKTPEEEIHAIKNIEIEDVPEMSPSNDEISPSNEQNETEAVVTEPESAVPETEQTVPEPAQSVPEPEQTVREPEQTVPEPEQTVLEPEQTVPEVEVTVTQIEPAVPKTESAVTKPEITVTEIEQAVTDEKTSNEISADDLQKESSLQIVTNVATVTVPNQTDVTKNDHTNISDDGDAKQKDQFLSQKIDTSSAQIIREQVPKLKDEA